MGITRLLRQETGEDVEYASIREYFEQCNLRQLLDSITIVYEGMSRYRWDRVGVPASWIAFAQRAFKEENVALLLLLLLLLLTLSGQRRVGIVLY